jgi:hypothetical protein
MECTLINPGILHRPRNEKVVVGIHARIDRGYIETRCGSVHTIDDDMVQYFAPVRSGSM